MPEKFKVVISGMSGRFPESDDVSIFKEKLYKGEEFITVDDRKWPVGYLYKLGEKAIPDPTGKLSNIHRLDYTVFKINTTFASSYDIINRLVLEPSFEAIVDAGINPYSLDGNNVGVFMSTGISDVESNIFSPNLESNILALIGCNKTMLSNRVSFALNLTGPSFTNHVDMHGGLESLSMAYKYISDGIVESAIVGVASSIVDPRLSLQYVALGILCPDGVTRPFDEWANGYARSEAVICFYLQRAEDAKRNYGEVKFCDFHYEGSKLSNFLGFNEDYIKTALRYLYEMNNFSPDSPDLGYIEMNAYGHKINDKVESNAIAELLNKTRNSPLLVGSLKGHTGHTEASSGMVSVLKALFALEAGIIAPTKNLTKVNSDIRAFKQKRLQVVTEQTSLPGNSIAVNSIGLFGSVGLTVLQQHEKLAPVKPNDEVFPRILLICGRKEKDLDNKLSQIEKLVYDVNFISLANDALGQHMPLHIYRGFTVLPASYQPAHEIKERGEQNRPVWFIFSGMGSQWNGMGKRLLDLPLFAEVVAKCDKVLREKNIDIYNILTSDDPKLFDDIINAFVGIITVQIGLYEIIKALGIVADGIIGHSVGENGCAYADGCLSLEQAVLASWARGVASTEVETIKGMMAAVGKGFTETKDTLPEDVQVACHNSADSCTLTGPAESVNACVQKLKKDGIFAKAVNVANIAYHSKYIAPAGPKLLQRLKQVINEPKKRSAKWISTSVPESEWDTLKAQDCSAEYLTNNLLSPVLFEEGCKHIPENAICIEFAPHGLLQAILKRSLPNKCTNIPLTSRTNEVDSLKFLLTSIGRLYIAGLEPQVNNIFPRVDYPVPRGTPPISPYCTWYHQEDPVPYHLQAHDESHIPGECIPISIKDDSEFFYLRDHEVNGDVTIPPSFFMYLVWWIFSWQRSEKIGTSPIVFEDVTMRKQVITELQETKYVSVMVQYGSGDFEVILRSDQDSEDVDIIMTGNISLEMETKKSPIEIDQVIDQKKKIVTKAQFYNSFEEAGYYIRGQFASINDLYYRDSEYETKVTWNKNWVTFLDALMKVQMFADNHERMGNIFPVYLRRLKISAPKFLSQEEGTLLPCKADAIVKQLTCPGIVMQALKYKLIPKTDKQLNRFRFVSYQNPRCQNKSEFLYMCLQIAVENLGTFRGNVNKVFAIDCTMNKYFHIIEDIIKHDSSLSLAVKARLHSPGKSLPGDEYILIITEDAESVEKLCLFTDKLLILIVSRSPFNKNTRITQHFVKVTEQLFGEQTFALLKRKNNYKQKPFVFIGNPNGHAANKINGVVDDVTPYFVVHKNIDFSQISKLMTPRKEHRNVRYLYIMDDIANTQQLDELIKEQIELNLATSILKQREWGLYRNLSLETNQKIGVMNNFQTPLVSILSRTSSKINYICHENKTMEETSPEKITDFAYVSLNDSGEEVIGLATIVNNPDRLKCDPHLFWNAQSIWNPREAVTVPYIYAQAYRALHLYHKGLIKTVLINVGKEYLLAEAFIALSLYESKEVFVVVDTDAEVNFIRTRFPRLRLDHILRSHNCSYEIQIQLRTNKIGVNLVVNCRSGIQHVTASLQCLKDFGTYLEVGKNNCLDAYNIGLYTFLRSLSFYVLQNTISDLLKLPTETKKTMKKFIDTCIKTGVIIPPKLDNLPAVPSSIRIIECRPTNEIFKSAQRMIKYDGEHSYIIVGSSVKYNLWFGLVEWLIAQGARKFTIVLEKCTLISCIESRINKLSERNNVKLLLTSISKLDTKQKAESLVKGIEKVAPLEAIFFVSVKNSGKLVSNLHCTVSPDVYFVGLASNGLKEFENRYSRGSPAILIYSDRSNDILTVLPHINELLADDDNNNAEIVYQATDVIRKNKNIVQVTHSVLSDYLPQDIETLNMIGLEEVGELTFTETYSLSLKYSQCKGVYPIFALPAVHGITLQPLFRRLIYPVFSATAAPIRTMKEAAHKLYQSLNEIQPSGPLTIISEAWTLSLALDIVSYAQLVNRKYKIIVLEGSPKNWSDQVKWLQSLDTEKSNTTYAEEIFHFANRCRSDGSTSFEDKVRMYAKNASCNVRTEENVIKASKMIKDKISKVVPVEFNDILLKNVIWFERYRPDDGEFNLSVTSEMFVLDEPNYRSLLSNPRVSQVINENAEYSFWEYTNLYDAR